MPSPFHGRLLHILVLTILITSVSVRLIPYTWSPLPYNIDGLSELRVANDIVSEGSLNFPSEASHSQEYVTDMPILGLLIAFVSSSTGVVTEVSALLLTVLIGSVTVLVVAVFILKLHSNSHSLVASTLAIALLGSFVFSAGCTWKETLGIFLLSIVLVSYLSRNETRYRMILSASLVLLVFTHHHLTVVTYVLITFAILIGAGNRWRSTEHRAAIIKDIAMVIVAWSVAVIYYSLVSLPYLDYLSPETDLYLYLGVAFLVLLVGLLASKRMYVVSRYPFGVIVPVLGASLLIYNLYDPIFPGIASPSMTVLIPFVAYLILVVPAWYGSEILLGRTGALKDFIIAMFLGPISLILFAFLRANDATSHIIVYRTFDLIMIPFALLVGVGFAYLIKDRKKLGAVAGIALVIICASTLPVAYQTQELFGVQNHTFEFEYDAVEWFSENGMDSYTSDQRLGETGWRLFDIGYGRGLPYDLAEGIALNPGSFYVTEGQWTYNGAQEFPFGVVVLEQETLDAVADDASVIYLGGPTDNQLTCFLTL